MLLGIDLGTGSAKALLLDIDGTVINEASSSYPVQAPHPGWAESNPVDWWLAVAVVVRKVVEKRGHQVRAIAKRCCVRLWRLPLGEAQIALSGQMDDVVPFSSKSGAGRMPTPQE